jgi:hypothetical protein
VDVGSVAAAAAAGSSKAEGRQQVRLQQRQQQLQQLRLMLAGMPLLQLANKSDTAAAAVAGAEGGSSDSAQPAAAAAAANGLEAADLPVQLPSGCFSASWQLPGSVYANLPAVEATLKGSSSSSTAQKAAHQKPANAAAGNRGTGSSTAAAAGGGVWADGLPPMRSKRARILKDGSLTLIPYGHDENILWLQRVHSFIGAVRCGLCQVQLLDACGGFRSCVFVWQSADASS